MIKDLVIINHRLALIVGEEKQQLVKINVVNDLVDEQNQFELFLPTEKDLKVDQKEDGILIYSIS